MGILSLCQCLDRRISEIKLLKRTVDPDFAFVWRSQANIGQYGFNGVYNEKALNLNEINLHGSDSSKRLLSAAVLGLVYANGGLVIPILDSLGNLRRFLFYPINGILTFIIRLLWTLVERLNKRVFAKDSALYFRDLGNYRYCDSIEVVTGPRTSESLQDLAVLVIPRYAGSERVLIVARVCKCR